MSQQSDAVLDQVKELIGDAVAAAPNLKSGNQTSEWKGLLLCQGLIVALNGVAWAAAILAPKLPGWVPGMISAISLPVSVSPTQHYMAHRTALKMPLMPIPLNVEANAVGTTATTGGSNDAAGDAAGAAGAPVKTPA